MFLVALLYGTMAAALLAMLFYLIQFKKDGKLAIPTLKSFLLFCGVSEGSDEETPVPLVSVREGVESFIYGHVKVFPALIVLTLAWSAGSIMTDVGADRLFERWILDSGMSAGALPTISFVIAMLIALCTGTSWGKSFWKKKKLAKLLTMATKLIFHFNPFFYVFFRNHGYSFPSCTWPNLHCCNGRCTYF